MGTKALIFEIIGVDRASQTFGKVSTAVAGTTASMERMQRASAMAGKALAIGLAGTAVGLYAAGKAAADDEAAQAQLAQQLRQAAGATDAQIASTEEWITAQGKAFGVADDELRPALARLATTTGSVSKAQRLAAIAMDIAAGSGKTFKQVTEAMSKAQNGSVGGLSKLGLATKNAAGDTMNFNQILKEGSEKYHGAAQKAAETTAGEQKILSVQLHELAEQIGTAALPAMGAFAEALSRVVTFISAHTHAVGITLAALGALLATVWAVGAATKAWAAVQAIAGVASKAFAAAQWLVNAALSANPIGLVVIAIVALVAGLVLAYRHSETFRNIVDKTFSFIGKVVPQVIGTVVGFIKNHWGLIVSIIGGPLGIVVVQVIKHFDTIKSVAMAAVDFVVSTAKGYGRFAVAVVDKVGDVVHFFRELPGKITGFLTGIPGQLKTIGGQIIQGLVDGLMAAGHKVTDYVTDLINKIPKKIRQIMGIASPSKVTYELGKDIGQGLADGIASKQTAAEQAAQKLADKAKAKLQKLKDAFASVKGSVAGNFTGNLFSASAQAAVTDSEGNVTTPAQTVGQNFLSNLGSTSGQLSKLIPAFKQLRAWGWKPGMLAQLFQSGGADLILELASNQSQATEAAGLIGGITQMSNALGGVVADSLYGDQIDAADGKGGKGGKGENRREVLEAHIYLDGKELADNVQVKLLRKKRQTGVSLGLA